MFYINLTAATLVSTQQQLNFTKVNGVQLDLPPLIGLHPVKPVTINKNDNAEGKTTSCYTLSFKTLILLGGTVELLGVSVDTKLCHVFHIVGMFNL